MSRKIAKKILSYVEDRQNLLFQILSEREMVKGSFCEIRVKCKKTCRCNGGRGHTHKRMSLRENGKSYSRAVPREDYAWIQEMTDNFRAYRKMRQKLAGMDRTIQKLLNQYEDEIVSNCKKGKTYLDVGDSEGKVEKPSEKGKMRKK